MNMFVNNVKSSRHHWNDPGMVLECKFEVRNVVIEQLMMMPTERSCLQHFLETFVYHCLRYMLSTIDEKYYCLIPEIEISCF